MTYAAKVKKDMPDKIEKVIKDLLEVPIKKLVAQFAYETGFTRETIQAVVDTMLEADIIKSDGEKLWVEKQINPETKNENES